MSKRLTPLFVLALLAALLALPGDQALGRPVDGSLAGPDAPPVAPPDASPDAPLPDGMLSDVPSLPPILIDAAPVGPRGGEVRLALPPGMTADDIADDAADDIANDAADDVADDAADGVAGREAPSGVQQVSEWRVDNGLGSLRITNLEPGPNHGFANRFDPSDFSDTDGLAPRPLKIRKIHFQVSTATSPEPEPTGPMEWHIWEDNGGHKADAARDIVEPFTVTGGPGDNVIDLEALGIEVVIDPPRMFHIGAANKESNETSPDLLLDSGLPFVGGSGDFHASLTYYEDYCRKHDWRLLAVDAQDGEGSRSPVWMAWLEVEWLEPPEALYFDEVARRDQPVGDFQGGSRIAWGDYDGDGLEDILANGGTLLRNEGDGTFTNVSEAAGITDGGAGALWADYDNDGDLDFYQYTNQCVPCGQDDNYDDLWRNDGDGTFTNVRDVDFGGDPTAPVPRDPLPTEAAAWADFNNDGYLDLYATNHVDWAVGTCFDDYLWLNNGPPDFTFRDASVASGIRAATLCGRGVNAADFDDDGWVDIFVSNYRLNRDLLWVNGGIDLSFTPQFTNEAAERGVQGTTKMMFAGSYGHTIGSVWGDLDNDTDQDLVASRLAHSAWLCFSDTTSVYASQGEGDYAFDDVRLPSGVEYVETHSDPSLVDFDNDGYLDLHLTHVYDGWRASTYRNATGDGELESGIRFENVTHTSGIYPRTAWGSGWADYDLDGDLDLASRGLWRNRASDDSANHWLQVEARGCGGSNRDAIGAKMRLTDGEGEALAIREVYGARGTGSQDTRVQHFGLGEAGSAEELQIRFPSGQTQVLTGVGADQKLTVTEVGAYVTPESWVVVAGQDLVIRADTCGTGRQVRWDLNDDNRFDDASGDVITARFTKPTPYQAITAEVTDGETVGRTRITVTVLPGPLHLPHLLRGTER